MKILVAYDGSLNAKEALRHGIEKARERNAEVIALHVFNRDILPFYDSLPGISDRFERDVARVVGEAEAIMRAEGTGVRSRIIQYEGSPEDVILSFAREEEVDFLLCPSTFKSLSKKFSVALHERALAVERAAREVAPQTAAS